MDIGTERRGDGRVVVSVDGEVDLYTGPRLRAALQAVVGEPGTGVVVDLRGVSFLDSYALGVLVASYKLHRAAGRGYAVVAGGGPVVRLFEVTGLRKVLPLHATVEDALAAG